MERKRCSISARLGGHGSSGSRPTRGSVRKNSSRPGAIYIAGSSGSRGSQCLSPRPARRLAPRSWSVAGELALGALLERGAGLQLSGLAVGCCRRVAGGEFEVRSVGAMITIENIYKNDYEAGNSRRDFLKGMLGAGAFVLGVSVMPRPLFAREGRDAGHPFPPSE